MKPSASQDLIDTLREHEVPFRAASTKGANTAGNIARFSIFFVYLLFLRKMYQAMGGGGGAGGGSGAPGKLATFSSDEPLVKFEDIEGIDDAKFEVMELVDTLRNPKKYEILGARAPTGLLLEGPPGTGKTMLARATAATAGVPLLYCSGSDFVEMFVGRGAARVRNTFSRAAKLSPCIIFIDELDALGKSRDMGGLGASMRSNDEAEQTLNQLLACMDGLDSSRRVCVLAATNRREVLDPALIRPGRFDRIIKVTLPDIKGRERILRVHAKNLGKGASVDLSAVAVVTKGLCGADLEYIVNEAAIRAVRRVSSKLRAGEDPKSITPTVSSEDFENSVIDFFQTRRPKGNFDLLSVLGK
ncbi:ftsh-like protein [Thalassiosira pseudonana CCMP1335]